MGVIGVWSMNVFNDRPSAGFGAAFFLVSFGQLIGPTAFAILAGFSSLTAAFYAAATITAATALIKPRKDLRTISPETGRSTD